MIANVLFATHGLAPTGPIGVYRRRDYLRGAGISAAIGLLLLAGAWVLVTAVGKSEAAGFLALLFLVSVGILMAAGATLVFLVCSVVRPDRPPLFADPIPRQRPEEDEVESSSGEAV